jgi:hypothetical protein
MTVNCLHENMKILLTRTLEASDKVPGLFYCTTRMLCAGIVIIKGPNSKRWVANEKQ